MRDVFAGYNPIPVGGVELRYSPDGVDDPLDGMVRLSGPNRNIRGIAR